jgi:hypothetical protein
LILSFSSPKKPIFHENVDYLKSIVQNRDLPNKIHNLVANAKDEPTYVLAKFLVILADALKI